MPAYFSFITLQFFSFYRYLAAGLKIGNNLVLRETFSLKLYHYLALRIAAVAAISKRASLHLLGDLSCS